MSALPFRPRAPGHTSESEYLAPGTVLQDRYEIIREIGRGGYSVVFLARDRAVDTRVAIKLLAPPPAAAREARERLRREVQAARGLTHGNIVAVHDLLEDAGRMFVVMEYVDGPDLAVHVREFGPLPADRAAALGRDIGAALMQAHRRGVLHRDIKPQNILLGPDDHARLTDFGAARIDSRDSLTASGGLVGTLPYIAPEVLTGERGDARSDIYGLGMTLYFALTGDLPERPAIHLPPPPQPDGYRPRARQPGVPEWLDDAVAGATTALPGDRFSSAAALVDALDRREDATVYSPEPRPPRLDFCLSCGSADSLGAGLCPSCASAPGSTADTLIYLQPAVSPAERKFIEEAVRVLAGETPDLRPAVEGHRPLARVPRRRGGVGADPAVAAPYPGPGPIRPLAGPAGQLSAGPGRDAGERAGCGGDDLPATALGNAVRGGRSLVGSTAAGPPADPAGAEPARATAGLGSDAAHRRILPAAGGIGQEPAGGSGPRRPGSV